MPLYEYECDACGDRIEILQRLAEPPLAHCPRCGGAMRKLLSAPAFQFKGSGWYVTDYGGRGGENAGGSTGEKSGDAAAGEGKSDAKAESKPVESKAESKPAPAATKE